MTLKQIGATILSRRIAECPETGAYLFPSNGHSRGASTYFLVIPERLSADKNSLRIKAWSDEEAIEIANRRLAKYLKVKP